MQRRTQTHRTQNKHTDPNTKTIAQTPNIDVFHEPPNLNMSGSPFLQKTSVKKNQNRFHQLNPNHDLDPNNNNNNTPIKEYNHITICLYTQSKAQQPK